MYISTSYSFIVVVLLQNGNTVARKFTICLLFDCCFVLCGDDYLFAIGSSFFQGFYFSLDIYNVLYIWLVVYECKRLVDSINRAGEIKMGR